MLLEFEPLIWSRATISCWMTLRSRITIKSRVTIRSRITIRSRTMIRISLLIEVEILLEVQLISDFDIEILGVAKWPQVKEALGRDDCRVKKANVGTESNSRRSSIISLFLDRWS